MIGDGVVARATTFPQRRGYVRQGKARQIFGAANKKGR